MGALLLLALGAGSASAAWPTASGAQVWVENGGLFSSRGADDRNLVNAPASAFATTPADLGLGAEVVAALNAGFAAQIDGALRDLHLKPVRGKAERERLAKAATPVQGEADRLFAMRVEASPDNGLGGHAAGNHLRVTVTSLHRAPDIAGVGEADVLVTSADQAEAMLRSAVVVAATEAFADLRTHLDDETTRARAFLTLVVDTTGLGAAQRDYATHALSTCAAQLAEPLSVTVATTDTAQASRIEYRLRRYELSETEELFVRRYAGMLSFEIGADGKCKCSTGGTPLEGFEVHVVRDLKAKQVMLRFVPKAGD